MQTKREKSTPAGNNRWEFGANTGLPLFRPSVFNRLSPLLEEIPKVASLNLFKKTSTA
jgi:hypothetical protein